MAISRKTSRTNIAPEPASKVVPKSGSTAPTSGVKQPPKIVTGATTPTFQKPNVSGYKGQTNVTFKKGGKVSKKGKC